ncbi:hypothetical protein ATO13_23811 [Stappia sp. 22II-S9-Z10]|nr:hypothetical protein ATO13_23811 [Stappia sp. 22II-S9-Z10]
MPNVQAAQWSDDYLAELVTLRDQHPTLKAAAEAAGLSWGKMESRLRAAAARGLDGSVPRPLPIGQRIKGVSTLYDAGGNVAMQWVKTSADGALDSTVDAIRSAFDAYAGRAEIVPPPAQANSDLLTVYPIVDHHLGLYAWAEETGEDWDLSKSEAALRDCLAQLVAASPSSGTAIVLNLGDFFHADSHEARTPRSGHALDVDTRHAKVLRTGVRLMIWAVELALSRHDHVVVRCLAGNHDPESSLALAAALAVFFEANPRVTVDDSPSLTWFYRFGRVLLGATHGHTIKPARQPGVMATSRPADWGETTFRYFYSGHIHHETALEADGVLCRTFQTLAARDAWHAGSGYLSGRSMTAITHHTDQGEICRIQRAPT